MWGSSLGLVDLESGTSKPGYIEGKMRGTFTEAEGVGQW